MRILQFLYVSPRELKLSFVTEVIDDLLEIGDRLSVFGLIVVVGPALAQSLLSQGHFLHLDDLWDAACNFRSGLELPGAGARVVALTSSIQSFLEMRVFILIEELVLLEGGYDTLFLVGIPIDI